MTNETRTLVVDDDPEMFLMGLKNLGYSDVRILESREGVIECIQEYDPKLVFLDTELDETHGFDVYGDIKRAGLTEGRVILGTSSEDSYEPGWMDVGADAFISKVDFVYNPEETEKKIRSQLEAKLGKQGEK